MSIQDDFFHSSSIADNADTRAVMDFLCTPASVNRMLVMTQLGLPALTGVVQELEERFAHSALFPLHHNAHNKNASNHRNVGWMVRFVMRAYGYVPYISGRMRAEEGGNRARIGSFSGARYFATAAVYQRTQEPPAYYLVLESRQGAAA